MGYCPFQQQNKIKKPRLLLSMHKAPGSSLDHRKERGEKEIKKNTGEKLKWKLHFCDTVNENRGSNDSILERESLEEHWKLQNR